MAEGTLSDRAALRRRAAILGVCVVVAASAFLLQPFGYPQGAHLALVHALADGTPRIDKYRSYSGDIAYYHGHVYSNKAPGLAFATLPAYVVLKALGLPRGDHVLTLVGVVLPALILLLLVRARGERLEPGLGALAAVTLGVATMVLPLTGLFFSHVLSALFAFAAFAVLSAEREGEQRLALVAAGGLLAGLAIVVEYPLGLATIVLGVYALARPRPWRRAFAYGLPALIGVAPLLAYNWWAFGDPRHLSYGSAEVHTGAHVIQAPGFHGVSVPNAQVLLELLFSARGLLIITPIVAVGVAGLVLLARRGNRLEAGTIAAVALLFILYNSGFWGPFGGWGPGPRYLLPIMPFLSLPLALTYRRWPLTTGVLAAASAAVMITVTITDPLLPSVSMLHGDLPDTHRWVERLVNGNFSRTVLSAAGAGHGWIAMFPFLAVLAAGLAIVFVATPTLPAAPRDLAAAVAAFSGWLLALHTAPELLAHDRAVGGHLGAVVTFLLAALVVATVIAVGRRGATAALAAAPLSLFVWQGVSRHPGVGLIAVVCAGLLSVAMLRLTAGTGTSADGTRSALDAPETDAYELSSSRLD